MLLLMSYMKIIFEIVFNNGLLLGLRLLLIEGSALCLFVLHSAIIMEGKEERLQITATNTRKLLYFIERTDNAKPQLPSTIPINQLAREYLNDDDFAVLVNQDNAFANQEEEKRMQEAFQKWTAALKGNCDIDGFLVYWI